jgi:hypothetical protein
MRENAAPFDGMFSHITSHDWDVLAVDAADTLADAVTLRLRVFYIIELIYHDVIPRRLFFEHANAVERNELNLNEFLKLTYPRAEGGLVALSADVKRLRGRASALAAMHVIMQNNATAAIQWSGIYKSCSELAAILFDIVEIARGFLRRADRQQMTVVGNKLYEILSKANFVATDIEEELRTLLSIRKDNAVSPWNKKVFQDSLYTSTRAL